jgi:hypothetical protein
MKNWVPSHRIWKEMLSEMYEDYTTDLVPESGHWIAEEDPGKCKTTPLPGGCRLRVLIDFRVLIMPN